MVTKYNSDLHRGIVAAAVASVGRAGGVLVAVKAALEAAGVEWPPRFNDSRDPEAIALDRDITAAMEQLQAAQ